MCLQSTHYNLIKHIFNKEITLCIIIFNLKMQRYCNYAYLKKNKITNCIIYNTINFKWMKNYKFFMLQQSAHNSCTYFGGGSSVSYCSYTYKYIWELMLNLYKMEISYRCLITCRVQHSFQETVPWVHSTLLHTSHRRFSSRRR